MIIRIINSTKQQPSDNGRVDLCLTGAAQGKCQDEVGGLRQIQN